jgi:Cu2+-exporting ATPase
VSFVGLISFVDPIKPTTKSAIKQAGLLGVAVKILTGDGPEVAGAVAAEIGLIDSPDKVITGEALEKLSDKKQFLAVHEYSVFARVSPSQKYRVIELLQKTKEVGFLGEGINDAPALTQAEIGLAIGAGTDVAIKSADIILVKSDPRDVLRVIHLSKATYRKMVQNLAWATGYNVLAIPLAAGVLYKSGILLSPAVGAVLMSLSTVIVAINAQLLRRAHYHPGHSH